MKTKYKILIASILVLSMLTAFAVTSFAYTRTDIIYDGNTYTYNELLGYEYHYQFLQIWDFDSILIYTNDVSTGLSYDYDYIILRLSYSSQNGNTITIYHNGVQIDYITLTINVPYCNIVLTGDFKYGISSSYNFDSTLTYSNDSTPLQYDIWCDSEGESVSSDYQVNLLNNKQPSPLEKVNDFLAYLSTALNKLTTMIITNQILILFIVAVPVVSFVIGSFKRIKDAGRV